jgi:membrane-associated protease RseP (regulator of RpoE activity)
VEVGAAGPIAGFLALLPFLAYGIWQSDIGPSLPDVVGVVEFSEPLAYNLLELMIWGRLGDGETLWLHPTGMAAWWGLLITLINMMPFAQLDGGHVWYALFGHWQRRLAWPLLGVLAALCLVWPGWLLWVVVIAIVGPKHPPMRDGGQPLGVGHRVMGWSAILIFIACWMTAPIKFPWLW